MAQGGRSGAGVSGRRLNAPRSRIDPEGLPLDALSYPYQLVAPLASPLAALTLLYLAICALLATTRDRPLAARAALVAVFGAALVLMGAAWLYDPGDRFAVLGVALLLVAFAFGAGGLPAASRLSAAPAWAGWVVIVLSTAVKCVALADFPAHLNAYSAETGLWGIYTLEGIWPEGFLRGKEYDLVNGGQSPLHLPVLWTVVRLFGGGIYALRFAEVVASTALLAILWAWLRGRVSGWWSVACLAAFAFSPWHLAQSRMGTFYSASVALGLAMLWIADRLDGPARARLGWWLGFGACCGLIGYAYAPLKVLYAFFFAVTVGLAWESWREGRPGWWRGPAAATAMLGLLVAVQLGWPPNFEDMFRRDFGPLATDTSIWHKTTADEVTFETQPVAVVAANLGRNLVEWWDRTWTERRILVWYAPALAVAVPLAAIFLFRRSYRVPALYFLIGVLPPLIIFPVQRRTLVLWPLVYVVGVLAARSLTALAAALVDRSWWRVASWTLLGLGALVSSAHGLRTYATTNSIVATGTYFGPEHRLQMMVEAERMLPTCRVYFVNATIEEKVVASVRLFEPARRVGGDERFGFVEYDGTALAVARDLPICFFHLARPDDPPGAGDVLDAIAGRFEGAVLLKRWAGDGSGTLLYKVVMVSAGDHGVQSRPVGDISENDRVDIERKVSRVDRSMAPGRSYRPAPVGEAAACRAVEVRETNGED